MTEYNLQHSQQLLDDFAKSKVPLIASCSPKIISLSQAGCEICIPLNNNTKNHVNSLYFGTLAIGADIAGGFLAMTAINQIDCNLELLFKDFKADFKKLALADTHFVCNDGPLIYKMIDEAVTTKQRINHALSITATTPSISNSTIVADFTLTLSLKCKESMNA